mmetsp:Transcript_118/g.201  ORF Transcript_118/g.201 Transcript_118/m.201 type:complete len:156 (-) Transcript_118:26-493(-)
MGKREERQVRKDDSLYDVLGVRAEASPRELRRRYREETLAWHPDRNPGERDAERFRRIQEAYEVLSDQERRRKYDERRTQCTGLIIADEVDVKDFVEIEPGQGILVYPCRCGGDYEFDVNDELASTIGCSMCSLALRLLRDNSGSPCILNGRELV